MLDRIDMCKLDSSQVCDIIHMGATSSIYLNYACVSSIRQVGLARTTYIRYLYGIFGREVTRYTVIYGVCIRFWPTLKPAFRSPLRTGSPLGCGTGHTW